jgi:hypothetical protein
LHTSVILALRRPRQEVRSIRAILGYTGRAYLEKKKVECWRNRK